MKLTENTKLILVLVIGIVIGALASNIAITGLATNNLAIPEQEVDQPVEGNPPGGHYKDYSYHYTIISKQPVEGNPEELPLPEQEGQMQENMAEPEIPIEQGITK